jgi:histone H3/H4
MNDSGPKFSSKAMDLMENIQHNFSTKLAELVVEIIGENGRATEQDVEDAMFKIVKLEYQKFLRS